jgi:predicted RNA-binding Zn ribbon-like protein
VDEATMARLGEEMEPAGRRPAQGPLRLVQQFLNTYNHEFPPEADRLGTPDKAARWMASHQLMVPAARVSESDRRRLVRGREALRALVGTGSTVQLNAEDLRVLNEAGRACLSVRFEPDGTSTLKSASRGADGALGNILAAVHTAWLLGTLPRLKACAHCRWIFYDRSKNRSGTWCSMRICGNRTKNRAYRHRRTGGP